PNKHTPHVAICLNHGGTLPSPSNQPRSVRETLVDRQFANAFIPKNQTRVSATAHQTFGDNFRILTFNGFDILRHLSGAPPLQNPAHPDTAKLAVCLNTAGRGAMTAKHAALHDNVFNPCTTIDQSPVVPA